MTLWQPFNPISGDNNSTIGQVLFNLLPSKSPRLKSAWGLSLLVKAVTTTLDVVVLQMLYCTTTSTGAWRSKQYGCNAYSQANTQTSSHRKRLHLLLENTSNRNQRREKFGHICSVVGKTSANIL
jgi:hypothetical protein